METKADDIAQLPRMSIEAAAAFEKRLTEVDVPSHNMKLMTVDTSTPKEHPESVEIDLSTVSPSPNGGLLQTSNRDVAREQQQDCEMADLSMPGTANEETSGEGKVPTNGDSHPMSSSTDGRGSRKTTNERKLKRQSRKESIYRHLFRDSFQMDIPLNVTADLGMAMQRSRANRVRAIYRYFPSIKEEQLQQQHDKEKQSQLSLHDQPNATSKDDPLGESSRSVKRKSLPKLKYVPRPQDYADVVDYLEAKYNQGIMIDHEEDDGSATGDNGNEDDGGSVYSESSFLDDTALKRTIAEQVLGQSTTTKLELIDENDDDFFVNVGPLEVEETELTNHDYDPLMDTEKDKAEASKRKRLQKKADKSNDNRSKKANTLTSSEEISKDKDGKSKSKNDQDKAKAYSAADLSGKKKKSIEVGKDEPPPKKKIRAEDKEKSSIKLKVDKIEKPQSKAISIEKKKPATSANTTDSKSPIQKKVKKPMSESTLKLFKKSKSCRKIVDIHLKRIEEYVKTASNEELPKKPKKKLRVELRCPVDKKTGDMITFSNPHVPGQKLRVKIPAKLDGNGAFKATVPLTTNDSDIDPDVDYNRISRKFYGLLEEYAHHYDEWCDAEGEYRSHTGDAEFTAHFEKRKKFDALIPYFPNTELKTPVDKAYLQKILRRARQNKNKRDKLMLKATNETTGNTNHTVNKSTHDDDDDNDDTKTTKKNDLKSVKKVEQRMQRIIVPQLATDFPRRIFTVQEIQDIWTSDS